MLELVYFRTRHDTIYALLGVNFNICQISACIKGFTDVMSDCLVDFICLILNVISGTNCHQ